jgi:hypothetical protein
MGANINPIYTRVAKIGMNGARTLGTALDAVYNGTSANTKILFTADATNGSYVQSIRLCAIGTNAVSKIKIYINDGTGTEGSLAAANNSMFAQVSLPATTASTTLATADVVIPLGFALPPGYKIAAGIDAGGALASGWAATVLSGDY